MPVRPAPTMIRCEGQAVSSSSLPGVRKGVESRPETGGNAGWDPVAITNRRALISMSLPTATVSGSVKYPAPSITRTPSAAMRSFDSFAALTAKASRTYFRTPSKPTRDIVSMPKPGASFTSRARRAAVNSPCASRLSGLPPSRPFSTSATDTPKAAAEVATAIPPAPPPITQISGLMTSGIPCFLHAIVTSQVAAERHYVGRFPP